MCFIPFLHTTCFNIITITIILHLYFHTCALHSSFAYFWKVKMLEVGFEPTSDWTQRILSPPPWTNSGTLASSHLSLHNYNTMRMVLQLVWWTYFSPHMSLTNNTRSHPTKTSLVRSTWKEDPDEALLQTTWWLGNENYGFEMRLQLMVELDNSSSVLSCVAVISSRKNSNALSVIVNPLLAI